MSKNSDQTRVFKFNGPKTLSERPHVRVDKNFCNHARYEYSIGELPGIHPEVFAGGKVALITMGVEVKKSHLAVHICAWAPSSEHNGYALYTIDFFKIEGFFQSAEDDPFIKLARVIETHRYMYDGRMYWIASVMIDATYLNQRVYNFCSKYEHVFPIVLRPKHITSPFGLAFDMRETLRGTAYACASVEIYTKRWKESFKAPWNYTSLMPMPKNNWSVPLNISFSKFKELSECLDTTIYNTVAIENIALEIYVKMGMHSLNWKSFWQEVEKGLYFNEWLPDLTKKENNHVARNMPLLSA